MKIALLLLLLTPALYATEPVESINFPTLIEYAEFADAAYLPEADINRFVQSSQYQLTQFHTLAEIQLSYFIATNDVTKTQLISVRGTSNAENTMVDLSLKLTQDQHTGIRLHSGFSAASAQIYSEIKPRLKKDYVINTTGHSLGGAVALVLAMYLDADHFRVGQVITFGQPKVTNIAGASKYQHLNVLRVVTPLDVVPLVPPFDPLDINNLDIYWHSGKEILLQSDTRYSVLEGVNSMLRATRFTQQRPTEENLQQHKMSFYLELLNKKKRTNTEVPYKNSLNLFNLFGAQ
ncbi:MAG: lipase family protein [Gammaproteobacteria bacterium]|nr:lipase family protein [Gammaproteobacteria bacterium]MBL6998535.1 lipase family protein [Gammaproteobacteria bacterium]